MKKILLVCMVAALVAAFATVCGAEPRTSGPGPFGANGGSEVQSPGNRPMPPVITGPHDVWPPVGAR